MIELPPDDKATLRDLPKVTQDIRVVFPTNSNLLHAKAGVFTAGQCFFSESMTRQSLHEAEDTTATAQHGFLGTLPSLVLKYSFSFNFHLYMTGSDEVPFG